MNDNPRERILQLAEARGEVRNGDAAEMLGITRQAAHKHLRRLVQEGKLVAEGAGRGARYAPSRPRFFFRFPLAGLAEDRAWAEVSRTVPLMEELPEDARRVLEYAATEMINNAIDHSDASEVSVIVEGHSGRLRVIVVDEGVGAFERIRAALGLRSDLEALQELSKGKTTTAPERHSGEGIFFSSKAVERFELESGRLRWIVDNEIGDMTVARLEPPVPGTRVRIELDPKKPHDLQRLFEEYTEDFEFARTRTVIKLFAYGVSFVSRSEAKRLVHGLEKFREVVLDFAGVEMVGQGFADEVFRVWHGQHREVALEPVNMAETVAFMIHRAIGRRESKRSPRSW